MELRPGSALETKGKESIGLPFRVPLLSGSEFRVILVNDRDYVRNSLGQGAIF